MKRPTPQSPDDLSLALSAARDAVGDAASLQRVRSGVLTKIASGAVPPASLSVAGAWLGKSLGALLLTAGASAAVYGYSAEPPPTAAHAPAPLAAPPAQLRVPPAADPLTAPTAAANPLAVPAAQPAAPAVEPAAAKPSQVAAPRSKTRRNTAPQPTAAATSKAACADAVAEVELLSRAQQALRSQPQAALSLLNEHAQRFSCGVLALERDSLRIDAERALGLHTQAAEHARELVARYPESAETRALKQHLDAAANSGIDHKNQPDGTPTP